MGLKPKGTAGSGPVHYDPVVLFLFFLASNFLLAYSHLSIQWKFFVGLMGILVPWSLSTVLLPGKYLGWSQPTGPVSPGLGARYLVPGIFLLGILLRTFQMVSFYRWPMWDHGNCGFYSLQLAERWEWKLWFTSEALPPALFWVQGLYFKLVPPSLFSFSSLSVIQSCLCLFVGYWAYRQWMGPGLTWLAFALLAASFWPVYIGKLFYEMGLLPIWSFGVLGLLGHFLRGPTVVPRWKAVIPLGLVAGMGPYIFLQTLPTLCLLSLIVVWVSFSGKSWDWKVLGGFFLPAALLSAPTAIGYWENIFHGHVASQLIRSDDGPMLLDQIQISLSYLTVFFWGTFPKGYFGFGPFWGGFLNPLLGSAALLGGVALFRISRMAFGWASLVFFLLVLPGIASVNLEMMRVLPILPYLLALTAVGIWELVRVLPKGWKTGALALLLLTSLGLDLYHLWGPCREWSTPGAHSRPSKSPEHYRAYHILDGIQMDAGPGLVLGEFYHDYFDQTLQVTTYGFDAAGNPALDPQKARWAAVEIHGPDREHFVREFPGAQFAPLSKGLDRMGIESELALIWIDPRDRERLMRWVDWHRRFRSLYPLVPYHTVHPDFEGLMKGLWSLYEDLPSREVFLRRCVLEKVLYYGLFSSDPKLAAPLLDVPIEELEFTGSFRKDCVTFFHFLGIYYGTQGDREKAERSFGRAGHFDQRYDLKGMSEYLRTGKIP